jgi:hypothetical protein
MTDKALLSLIGLLICLSARAQDWQTVHSTDTLFFYSAAKPSAVIRAITVARTTATASDSSFYFPATWRDTAGGSNRYASKCIDSNAPSWMGRMCVHHSDGEEWYFNRQNDTFRIMTQAQSGDSWTLLDDHKGLTFRATIIAADTMSWGASIDSFKTASIQAYNGNSPVNHYGNKLLLKWSKSNGWLKTMDVYAFPRFDSVWDYIGEGIDSSQHTRFRADWPEINLRGEDIFTKYQVGNEWVYYSESVNYSTQATTYSGYHDSVMSVTILSGTQLKAEILRYSYSVTVGPNDHNPKVESWSKGVQTVQQQNNLNKLLIKDLYFYDLILKKGVANPVTGRLYTGTADFCGNYGFRKTDITPCSLPPTRPGGGCYKVGCIDGVNMHVDGYLSNFGQTYHYYEFNDMYSYMSKQQWGFSYIKLGNCESGTKTILYTSVPRLPFEDFKVFPNPANANLKIELPVIIGTVEASLFNAIGQCVFKQQFDGKTATMNVASMPAGLYWLEIVNQQGRAVKRIIVVH